MPFSSIELPVISVYDSYVFYPGNYYVYYGISEARKYFFFGSSRKSMIMISKRGYINLIDAYKYSDAGVGSDLTNLNSSAVGAFIINSFDNNWYSYNQPAITYSIHPDHYYQTANDTWMMNLAAAKIKAATGQNFEVKIMFVATWNDSHSNGSSYVSQVAVVSNGNSTYAILGNKQIGPVGPALQGNPVVASGFSISDSLNVNLSNWFAVAKFRSGNDTENSYNYSRSVPSGKLDPLTLALTPGNTGKEIFLKPLSHIL